MTEGIICVTLKIENIIDYQTSHIFSADCEINEVTEWIDSQVNEKNIKEFSVEIKDIYRTVPQRKVNDTILNNVTIVNINHLQVVPIYLKELEQLFIDEEYEIPPYLQTQINNNHPEFNYIKIINTKNYQIEGCITSHHNPLPRSDLSGLAFRTSPHQIDKIKEIFPSEPKWYIFNEALICQINHDLEE